MDHNREWQRDKEKQMESLSLYLSITIQFHLEPLRQQKGKRKKQNGKKEKRRQKRVTTNKLDHTGE